MIYKRKKHFVAPRNRYKKLSRFLFWFITVVFLSVVIYILFFSSFLAITSVRISGEKYISENDITDQIKPIISGNVWKIINKNSLLLVRKSDIRKNILQKFRQIRSVSVQKKFPSELDVNVDERTPTMLFQGGNGWFILDENAIAYDTADPNSDKIKQYGLLSLTETEGKNVNLGDTVLSQNYLTYVAAIKEKMKDRTEIQIGNDFQTPSLISEDIRVKTQEGWGIYFNENIALDKEFEMLNAVLNNTIDKSQRPDLEYIDLRIDNKVYYKFRDGTPEETARLAETAADQAAADATASPTPTTSSDKKDKKNH